MCKIVEKRLQNVTLKKKESYYLGGMDINEKKILTVILEIVECGGQRGVYYPVRTNKTHEVSCIPTRSYARMSTPWSLGNMYTAAMQRRRADS
jgi:hypothetical protein